MSEYYCVNVRINNKEKHPNADTLALVNIFDGYPVVVKDSEVNVGDLFTYISPDAMLPMHRPEFNWLQSKSKPKEWHRLRAAKLRGVFSMGLLVPAPPGTVEGQDVSEILGVVKYEPPVERVTVNEAGKKTRSARNYETQKFDRVVCATMVLLSLALTIWFPPWYIMSGGALTTLAAGLWAIQWNRRRNQKPMIPYYDLDGYRRYKDIFQEFEPVSISEKVHGCVPNTSTITMADGSFKYMHQIEIGDYILGVDGNGNSTSTKVINKFNNGKCEEWMRLSGNRRSAGRGYHRFVLKCTPNHKVYCPNKGKYLPAGTLQVGDNINVVRTDPGLSPIQYQVLLGKMLGDGCYRSTSETGACIQFGHKEEDFGYLNWTIKALGSLCLEKTISEKTSGYGTEMVSVNTNQNYWIYEAFHSMKNSEGKKYVPEWVASKMTPLTLAFWYMDDGSLGHHEDQEDRANFAVCGFTEEDCKVLTKGLLKFDILATFYQDPKGYSRLRLNAEEAEKFFLLVAPYIPKCMHRKLPERHRTSEGWLPNPEIEFKPIVTSQTIDLIERNVTIGSSKYDLETETHNYFANGVLVHNCSASYVYSNSKFHVKSRTVFRTGNDLWTKTAEKYGLEEVMKKYPNLVLFGEIFGDGVQDLTYGGGLQFVAFDLMDLHTRQYYSVGDFQKWCDENGVPRVPVLYEGPWKNDLTSLAEGVTTLRGGHVREGIVIKPQFEARDNRIGRKVLKLPGSGFLLR